MENEIEKAEQLIAEKIKQNDEACILEVEAVLKKYERTLQVESKLIIKTES